MPENTATAPYPLRQERLAHAIKAAGLDALVLNPGPSLIYLTGLHFHLMERPVVLLFAPGDIPRLVLPELEVGKTTKLPFPLHPHTYGEDPHDWGNTFVQAWSDLKLKKDARIGVEPRSLRVLELRLLEYAAPKALFISGEDIIAELRMAKDPAELAAMRRAVQIAQNALLATLPSIKLGMTEKELASELTMQLLRNGAESKLPFAPIVCAGPNSANPHAVPSERRLQAGDLLIIDWGATYDNYLSDLTRTFAIGETSPEHAHIAQVVAEANQAGRDAAAPGVPASVVDSAARQVIEKAGYGPYFIHRTGHGLGMEEHEEPYIRSDNTQILSPGMTFTVEPGIYLPERGGVRIEDNVVITESGSESLSNLPRELKIVG
jgi:Xaa-Pro dipeptidase